MRLTDNSMLMSSFSLLDVDRQFSRMIDSLVDAGFDVALEMYVFLSESYNELSAVV